MDTETSLMCLQGMPADSRSRKMAWSRSSRRAQGEFILPTSCFQTVREQVSAFKLPGLLYFLQQLQETNRVS